MAKTIDEMISVMTAFKNGKKIESQPAWNNNWIEIEHPKWDWFNNDYRVKEEAKYRAYENTDELIEDFCQRKGETGFKLELDSIPLIWVENQESHCKDLITQYTKYAIRIGITEFTLVELFNTFIYLDGSPCGVKE